MSITGFLLDEHIPLLFQERLIQLAPTLSIYAIGYHPAPPRGTLDPEILIWVEMHGCMLVTNNRASMPVQLKNHIVQGRHVPGIVQFARNISISKILDDLILISSASLPGEFQDQIVHLPLRR